MYVCRVCVRRMALTIKYVSDGGEGIEVTLDIWRFEILPYHPQVQ